MGYRSVSVTATGRCGVAPSTSLVCKQHLRARMAWASLRTCAAGTLADAPEQKEREERSGDDTVQKMEEEGAAEGGSGGCEWMRLRVDVM
jgi:hypothetical protein